jgi:hypothetical protein
MPAVSEQFLAGAADYFSEDYAQAHERFCAAALVAGAALHALPIDARGPSGGKLTIDIAWLGSRHPRRVLLHTSGLHGVEAFAGSAVQLSLLAQFPAIPEDCAMILAHVLNPYGMAWLRRANECNVDLNRNFLTAEGSWSGAAGIYAAIDSFLNPPSPPGFDFFPVRAAWHVLRHGIKPLQQAVAQGQYEFPRGLFFGGKKLEQGPRIYLDWISQNLSGTEYLFALDVHTGLGRWGCETLIAKADSGETPTPRLCAVLKRPRIDTAVDGSITYAIRGGMGESLPYYLPATRIDFLLQELGTYPPMHVFHALREENRWHYHGQDNGNLKHPAKLRLREALCPAAPDWRRQAVMLGAGLAYAAADWTFRQENQH